MPKINQLTPAAQIEDTDVLAKENASGTSTEAVTAAQLAEYAKRKGIQVDNTLSTPGAAADAAKTGDAIADLKNAVTDITANTQIPMTAGKYIDLSVSSVTMIGGVPQFSGNSSTYSVGYMACSPGDVFTVSGTGGIQTRLWGFITSDGTILSPKAASSATAEKLVLTAPNNAAFIIVHTKDEKRSYKGMILDVKIDELKKTLDNRTYSSAPNIEEISSGHIIEYPTSGDSHINIYRETDGVVSVTSSRKDATDYLPCRKYLLFAVESGNYGYINFYRKVNNEYVIANDLQKIKTGQGYYGYIAFANNVVRAKIDVDEECYIKIATTSGSFRVFGWDGIDDFCDLSGNDYFPYTANANERSDSGYDVSKGRFGVTIPGNAYMVFTIDAIITCAYGIRNNGNKTVILDGSTISNSQNVLLLPDGYRYFRLAVSRNTNNSTTLIKELITDANEYVHAVTNPTKISGYGKASLVEERAKKLDTVKWTCKKKLVKEGNSVGFNSDVAYHGIPYYGAWNSAELFGWHVSAQTFQNAANDPNSHFYDGGNYAGYGISCTPFAELAAGFPYPIQNALLPFHPFVDKTAYNDIPIGIPYQDKGRTHSVICTNKEEYNGIKSYSLHEGIQPNSSKTVHFSCVPSSGTGLNKSYYNYLNDYYYAYSHQQADPEAAFPYDVENYTITNGSARPYRGDKCVYTSDDANLYINLYAVDSVEPTKLYIQQVESDLSLISGTQKEIDIASRTPMTIDGGKRIDIKADVSVDGLFAIWTDADDKKEYFEYHDVSSALTISGTANNIVFPNVVFWYAMVAMNKKGSYVGDVPMLRDNNGDYSAFFDIYTMNANHNSRIYIKGEWGAYVRQMTYTP